MVERELKNSISYGFVDKTPITSKLAYKDGFIAKDLSLIELAYAIDCGLTFSYQFKGNVRSAENFIATDILAIDIDYGLTISEALEQLVVKKYCSMFYTTVNHSPDHHRFRLIFVLPRTITNARELSAATRSLAQRLGGDRAATDAARMFHGCKDSNPELFDGSIDDAFLQELIADGLSIPVSESVNFDGSTSNRSDYRPEQTLMVRTRNGQMIEAVSVDVLTPIHCPFHNDHNPSAFVNKNKRKSTYIYCPRCQKTWWLSGDATASVNFDDFEQVVVGLKDDQLNKANKASLKSLFAHTLRPDNIHISSTKHLEIPELQDGITLIKSPKGSGKTTFLAGVLKDIIHRFATLEEYEENTDPEVDEPFLGKEKILLIGHRQALIGELCQRLHLNCYLDDKGREYGEVWDRRNRYGVCLDSLWKVEDRSYDIVVIDEVEQVLAHFLSDTLGEKRYGTFGIFAKMIRNAKKVVALDADLGWITFTTLTDLITTSEVPKKNKNKKKKDRMPDNVPVHIYINQMKVTDRTIHTYPNISQLIQKIKRDVAMGSRIFVCSNSKKKIKAINHSLTKLEKDLGHDVSRIIITSENSGNKEVQAFIKNITSEVLKYQVILCSPSLGTGIDISFDDDSQEIDAVYGIFENQVTTHFEIDQQLARVRNPKEVHAWVSPACFNFETEFDVVKYDFLKRTMLRSVGEGMSPYNQNTLDDFSPFIKLASMVISHQRASKNNLSQNFKKYRLSQGWSVNEVPFDEDLKTEGQAFFKVGKALANEENIQAIVTARVMDKREYDLVSDKLEDEDSVVSEEEWNAFHRTRIELFYRESVSRDLLDLDKGGKYRRAVSLYESVSLIGSTSLADLDKNNLQKTSKKTRILMDKLFVNRAAQCMLIHALLSTTPFYKKGAFDTDITFTKDDLKRFIEASIEVKSFVDTQLGINTQSDIHIKPTQHLGRILGAIGLSHKKIKDTNKDGDKVYTYQLNKNEFDSLNELVNRRKEVGRNGWDFIDQTYGFTYPTEEGDELSFLEVVSKRRSRHLQLN